MIAMLEGLVELPQPLHWLAELAVAVTVCLGVAWVAVRCCHRRSAAMRAHLWLLGFAAATVWIGGRMAGATYSVAILPAVTAPAAPMASHSVQERPAASPAVPTSRQAPVRLLEPEITPPSESQEVLPAPAPSFFARTDWARWAARAWGLGTVFLLLRIFAGVWIVGRLLRSARPIEPGSVLAEEVAAMIPAGHTKLHVMLHSAVSSPVSFGAVRGWVLLPDAAVHWDAARVRLVLAHEVAHCLRWDYLSVLFLRLFAAVCWFHPFTWLGLRRFRALCENAADDRALESMEATAYAEELLRIVRELRQSPPLLAAATLSIGEPTTLRERIAAMLDATRERGRLSLRASLVTTLVAGVAAIFVSGLRLVHAENPKPVTSATAMVAADKSTTTVAGNHAEMKEITLSVCDENGLPVAGAEIKPTGCRAQMNADMFYLWNPSVPMASAKTNEMGRAVLRVPAFTKENEPINGISADVEHSGYCFFQAEFEFPIRDRLVLKRGSLVKLRSATPVASGTRVCADLVVLDGGDAQVLWTPRADAPGVQGRLLPGDYAIRAVAVDPEGRPQFSELQRLSVRAGRDEELSLPLKASTIIRGRLTADVPTPIAHGQVVGSIVSSVNGEEKVSWQVWAPIQPDGTFEIKDAPLGRVELVAQCDGFVSRNPEGEREGRYSSVRPQTFRAGENIVIAMEKSGAASVTVITPDGKPLRDVEVCFFPEQKIGSRTTVLARHYDQATWLAAAQYERVRDRLHQLYRPVSVWTDENGRATIPNLPQATHTFYVAAVAKGWEMPLVAAETGAPRREGVIEIKRGEVTSQTIKMESKELASVAPRGDDAAKRNAPMPRIDPLIEPVSSWDPARSGGDPFPVTPGKDLVGRVVDGSGAPLAGVLVDAWTWEPGNETVTDLDGRFRLANPKGSAETIEIQFGLAGFSPVYITRQPIGQLGRDVVLSTRPYFEGVVTDSQGQPMAHQLIRVTAGPKDAEINTNDYWCEAHTDDQGRYRLHVFPDTYRLEVRSKAGDVARIPGLEIRRDETRHLDIQLSPGLTFRATVVDAGTGAPIAGIRFSHWQHPGIEGVSDAQGNIAIAAMFPGDFTFEIEAGKPGYVRWWSPAAVNDWERRRIEDSGWQRNFDMLTFAIAPDTRPVRIEMEKGVTIRGRVRNPEGQPVAGASVMPALSGSGYSLSGDMRFRARTAKDGSFAMLLPASNAATYHLLVHDGGYQQWRGLANGVLPPISTKPGQVVEGVELSLTEPCVVRGKVVDESGQVVAGREVRAVASDNLEQSYYWPTTRTAEDGSFELRFVRPGRQRIQAVGNWLEPHEVPAEASVEVTASADAAVTGVVLKGKFAK